EDFEDGVKRAVPVHGGQSACELPQSILVKRPLFLFGYGSVFALYSCNSRLQRGCEIRAPIRLRQISVELPPAPDALVIRLLKNPGIGLRQGHLADEIFADVALIFLLFEELDDQPVAVGRVETEDSFEIDPGICRERAIAAAGAVAGGPCRPSVSGA